MAKKNTDKIVFDHIKVLDAGAKGVSVSNNLKFAFRSSVLSVLDANTQVIFFDVKHLVKRSQRTEEHGG